MSRRTNHVDAEAPALACVTRDASFHTKVAEVMAALGVLRGARQRSDTCSAFVRSISVGSDKPC
jgi:hypothetical protein